MNMSLKKEIAFWLVPKRNGLTLNHLVNKINVGASAMGFMTKRWSSKLIILIHK
jgi:hypothetical protein